MKTHRETLTLNIPERMAFVNITPQVEAGLMKRLSCCDYFCCASKLSI